MAGISYDNGNILYINHKQLSIKNYAYAFILTFGCQSGAVKAAEPVNSKVPGLSHVSTTALCDKLTRLFFDDVGFLRHSVLS